MSLVRINLPPGITSLVPRQGEGSSVGAATSPPLVADQYGQSTFDTASVSELDLLDAGCTFPVSLYGTTANRPTIGLYPGQMFFDTTLGRPIWRSAFNWVDSTGTPA